MSDTPNPQVPIEPERYELSAQPFYHFAWTRREFFQFLGAGMLVLGVMSDAVAMQESGRARRRDEESLPKEVSSWLHIAEDGGVTVFTGKVEVGQDIRTSLTQAVAEELKVPVRSIRMVMGDTQLVPFDMGTFGSRTTPTMNLQLRRVAAAARDSLIQLAAVRWSTDAKTLSAKDGKISDASGHSVAYSDLLKGQQITEMLPAEDPLEPASEWRVAGKPLVRVNGRELVTGEHRYPSDRTLPGMLYGTIVRPEAFHATLVSADTAKAEKMPGVTLVRDGDFLGVVAPTSFEARKAAESIEAKWKSDPQASNKDLFDVLRKTAGAESERDRGTHIAGSIEQGLAAADHRLKQTYTVQYIAHTPLEPRAALAQWDGDKLTVWTGTQRPFGVRQELAEAFHLNEDQVHVFMPDTGAGYGGKHTGETAIEAARLARAAKRPVKVNWTREEEFTWAYFRPAGVIDVSSGVKNDGTITAWEFHNYNSGSAGIPTFYDIPNQHIQFHASQSPLRQGSYRGLAATANHFARESHMDELAQLVKMDPLEFRLKNLKNERLRAVFQAAAEKFGWSNRKKEPGHGFGMGGGFEKGGNVATVAEVSVDRASGKVKIERLVTAFECGAIVNPENLENQVSGANIMGIGGALFESIEFADGKILNPRLSQYRVPRFSDVPQIEVVLLDRKDIPSAGAGETPIVGVAPAVGNAIFDATGVRLRSLPMVPNGLPKA